MVVISSSTAAETLVSGAKNGVAEAQSRGGVLVVVVVIFFPTATAPLVLGATTCVVEAQSHGGGVGMEMAVVIFFSKATGFFALVKSCSFHLAEVESAADQTDFHHQQLKNLPEMEGW